MDKEFDVWIDGVRLKMASSINDNNRPTIIFLHESFGCIRHWRDFPYRMAEAVGINALIYDRQGYGQSDPFTVSERTDYYLENEADVLRKIILALDLKNVILFGHSDGGSIALIAAAKYPGMIEAVITEGAHVMVEGTTLEGIGHAVELYRNSDLKRKLEFYHGEKTEMVFRLWAETWLSNKYRDWEITPILPKIECPVFVIQGVHDQYGSIAQVHLIKNNTGGTTKSFMPDTGHTPHREAPSDVILAVKEFILSSFTDPSYTPRQ